MNRKCPACGELPHTEIRQIHMTLPQRIPLPEWYNIVACSQCGCCFADTSASQADYDVYYSNYNNYSGQGENKTFEKFFSPVERFLKENLDASAAILDIGFGKGELLTRLHKLGYTNLTGIDPSQHSVDSLNKRGIRAYRKSVYDAPGELQNSFDLAFLSSVVEHLLEPKAAIDQACAYLKKDGYLIIDIPDYAMCDQVDLPIPNQFNQEHINYFSEASFTEMLRRTQCRLLYSKSIELRDETSSVSEYSRMFMLQKRGDSISRGVASVKKDADTEAAIRRYLLQQEARQEKMAAMIADLCANQTPLIIWGTGAMTMSLLASTELSKCNIVAFADGNPLKRGVCINEKRIIAPEDIDQYPEAVIAISVMKFADEIKERITALALPNPVVVFV